MPQQLKPNLFILALVIAGIAIANFGTVAANALAELWSQNGDDIYYNAGKVGIGTDSPAYALDIYSTGMARLTGESPRLRLAESDTGDNWDIAAYSGNFYISDVSSTKDNVLYLNAGGGAIDFMLDDTGNISIGGPDYSPDFQLEIASSTPYQGYFGITNSTDGDIFAVDANGNVGVGANNPQERLDVNGNIKLNGNIVSDGDICIGQCD